MIKENKVKKEFVERKTYCDVCGNETRPIDHEKCSGCKIDLCAKCIFKTRIDVDDCLEDYCKKCWNIGEPFRAKIKQLENQIEFNNDEWKRLCGVKND